MDTSEQFEQHGFLSLAIANKTTDVRAENVDWFNLADDTNAALMRAAMAAMQAVRTTSWTPEAVAVRVLLRSCGMLQGIILVTERGMVAEGRTLARNLLEAAFCIAALHDDPDVFIKMIQQDSEASRRNQAKFIEAENLIESGASKEKLKAVIDEIGKAKIMNVKELTKLGPLTKQYLSYQRLSDDAAHVSARSLHRHMWTDPNRSGWCYKWGPGAREENAATLFHVILAAIPIGVGITQMLKNKSGNAEFGELANRFHAMPPIAVV